MLAAAKENDINKEFITNTVLENKSGFSPQTLCSERAAQRLN
jgi:hypothetical protein